MTGPLEQLLAAEPLAVLDGALATELERRGADLHDPLWSAKVLIEQPDLIRAVHVDYFNAGADIATTATYQATFEGFKRRGVAAAAAAALMRHAVGLAVDARDEFWSTAANRFERPYPLVAASIGSYGAMLADGAEFRGRYAVNDHQLRDFHRPRLQVLAESGADLLGCETIPCLREALVLAELLEEFPSLSAWISFSCQDGGHNAEGEAVAACAGALDRFPQIAAVGVNCTRPEHVASILGQMRERTGKPLIAYPNSGGEYDAAAKIWHGAEHAVPFTELSQSWYEAGARVIGGCCRTTPRDIPAICALRRRLAERSQ